MSVSDQLLMAYVDGELSPDVAALVLKKVAKDPAALERLQEHQRLRSQVAAAYSPVMSEPMPARFSSLFAETAPAQDRRARQPRAMGRVSSAWPVWAMAAATLIGVGLSEARHALVDPLSRGPGGALAASGSLARALDHDLSGGPADSGLKVTASFRAGDGRYCRLFRGEGEGGQTGVACRGADRWTIESLAAARPAEGGAYRQAGSSLPSAVIDAMQDLGGSEPLSPAEERAARASGWQDRTAARPGAGTGLH